jgi:hypothetical protein
MVWNALNVELASELGRWGTASDDVCDAIWPRVVRHVVLRTFFSLSDSMLKETRYAGWMNWAQQPHNQVVTVIDIPWFEVDTNPITAELVNDFKTLEWGCGIPVSMLKVCDIPAPAVVVRVSVGLGQCVVKATIYLTYLRNCIYTLTKRS